MRLRWLIVIGAVGLPVAWWYGDLSAVYIAVFGCLILYSVRVLQFRLVENEARVVHSDSGLSRSDTFGFRDANAAALLLERRKLLEQLQKGCDAPNKDAIELQLAEIDSVLFDRAGLARS